MFNYLYVLHYSTVPCVLYYRLIAIIVITLHLICIVGISKIRTFLSYGHCPVPWCPVKGGSTVASQLAGKSKLQRQSSSQLLDSH